MGQREAGITTNRSIKECAELFRHAISNAQGVGSKLGGFAAKLKGNDNTGFYTPTNDSPFAALEDDMPTFMVGAFIPKLNAGALGNGTDIHMYVWDRGTHREVEFFSPHRFGGGMHAQKLVGKCLEVFGGTVMAAPNEQARQASSGAPPPNIPAGWHPDPHEAFELRYWNGAMWTEHVSTNGQQAIDRR